MSEFPPHKIRHRFLFRRRLAALKWLGRNLRPRFQPEQGTSHQCLWRHGDFLQLAMKINKSRRFRIGPLQFAFDSNFAD